MTFCDRRRREIENFVPGPWVLTKTDKDGQFKKFKDRWVCNGYFRVRAKRITDLLSRLKKN